MAKWNTQQIVEDLKTIVGIVEIQVVPASEALVNLTTESLVITLGGVEDSLFVFGFNFFGNDPREIQLTDGISRFRGLSSTDYRLARAYIDVRQYFINRDFKVVGNMFEE